MAATILAVVASAAMIGIQTQMSQYALAQTYGRNAASASAGSASSPVMVDPSQTTNKEFWINTVHLDGATSLHAAVANPLHHIITVDGVGTFALHRGEIHTVSFIANNPGTINFFCSIHLPNMVGQILVLESIK